MIGRSEEIKYLEKAISSSRAELIAVIGRRRVGKTYLVRKVASGKGNYAEFVGLRNAKTKIQVLNCFLALQAQFETQLKIKQATEVDRWEDFFASLTRAIKAKIKQNKNQKIVIFFDELPWFCKKGSSFLSFFDYYWNSEWSKIEQLKIIICGSATGWMIEKIFNNTGGLYNRITGKIHLLPFSIKETDEYLNNKGIKLSSEHLVELYMVLGGIPYYLDWLESGLSAAQLIDKSVFSKSGILNDEFGLLIEALFRDSKAHIKIINQLAAHHYGLTAAQISKSTKISIGKHFEKLLTEQEACGFIKSYIPYGKLKRDKRYRLLDQYMLFYKNFIERFNNLSIQAQSQIWLKLRQSTKFVNWAGYSFETFCHNHASLILRALGIDGVLVNVTTWHDPKSKLQVDLVLERADRMINLVEIKYTNKPFAITKDFVKKVKEREAKFVSVTKTKLPVNTVLLSAYGVTGSSVLKNEFFRIIELKDLLRKD